jgi:hyperosmotically inducible protein
VTRVKNQLRVRESTTRDADARGDVTASERATRVAENPDAWITAKVQAKYFLDTDVKGRNISVDTRQGVVTLRGEVESEGERRRALAIARNTDGVESLNDELRVVRSDAQRADSGSLLARREAELGVNDVWITTKVQAQFFLDDDIKGQNIIVDAREGVIYLKGTVESGTQKQLAETIARDTDGVSRVENLLKVDTAANRR